MISQYLILPIHNSYTLLVIIRISAVGQRVFSLSLLYLSLSFLIIYII